MAFKIKELGKKTAELIEEGNEAERKVRACRSRVSSDAAVVAGARAELSRAMETDENGKPKGDVGAARAYLDHVSSILAASQRALAEAQGTANAVKAKKQAHVRTLEQYSQGERKSLERARALESLAFAGNSEELRRTLAEHANEAEDSRVELLRSMGIEATAEHVSAGGSGGADISWLSGGFGGIEIDAESTGYRGGSGGAGEYVIPGGAPKAPPGGGLSGIGEYIIPGSVPGDVGGASGTFTQTGGMGLTAGPPVPQWMESYNAEIDRIMNSPTMTSAEKLTALQSLRSKMLARAKAEVCKSEAAAIKTAMQNPALSADEKKQLGRLYIADNAEIVRNKLIESGIQDNAELNSFISGVNEHYSAQLEKFASERPNAFFEEPNYDTISKLSVPFCNGMMSTIKNSPHKDVREIYSLYANKLGVIETNYTGGAYYSSAEGGIHIDKTEVASGDGVMDRPYQVGFHEFGHNIDFLLGNGSPISETWGNNALYEAIRKDFETLRGKRTNEQLVADLKAVGRTEGWTLYQVGSVSDILESMTGIDMPLGAGHCGFKETKLPDGTTILRHVNYWESRLPNKEFFAETLDGAASNSESYQMMKRFFPNAVATVHKIIGSRL